jgi:outer membrane receptor protein involved in Fe transport
VSLRVRNLLDDDATTPASAVDNGRGQAHILQRIYQTPRTGELSAAVRF